MNDTDPIDTLDEARLREVADELFGPSTSTLAAVALGGDSVLATLPATLQERLKSPILLRRIEILRNSLGDSEQIDRTPFLTPMPRGSRSPAQGEIRVLEGVDVNDPSTGLRHSTPVLVLLDRLVNHQPDASGLPVIAWQAWTVSSYVGFAGHWDVLLQGDNIPPACAMVQVWNVVHVLDKHLGVCRLRLDTDQTAQVHAVWTEFVSGGQEPETESEVGAPRITAGIRITPQGMDVVTGSPSTGPEDPRFMFQRFYMMIREALGTAYRHELHTHSQASSDVAKITEYAKLIARVTLRGLHDGQPSSTQEATGLPEIASRLGTGTSPLSKSESSWIQWGGYAAAERRFSLGLLKERLTQLSPDALAYEFFVAVKGTGPKLESGETPEELIKIKGTSYEHKGKKLNGVFLLESHYPVVQAVLAGRVDIEIEVVSNATETSHLIRVTIRAA